MDLFLNLFSTSVAYGAVADMDAFIAKVNTLIVNPLIGFLFALAVVYFLYGVFEFISNQENEEKKTTGKSHMLWGVIGMTIMMGVWGLLSIVLNTLDIPKSQIDPEKGEVTLPPYIPPPNWPK